MQTTMRSNIKYMETSESYVYIGGKLASELVKPTLNLWSSKLKRCELKLAWMAVCISQLSLRLSTVPPPNVSYRVKADWIVTICNFYIQLNNRFNDRNTTLKIYKTQYQGSYAQLSKQLATSANVSQLVTAKALLACWTPLQESNKPPAKEYEQLTVSQHLPIFSRKIRIS